MAVNKKKEMKIQPVAFNLADPDQQELFNHAMKRTNFSGYIKRLIQRDMEGLGGGQVRHYQEVEDEADIRIDADLISGLI